jgi:hypothetical protein
MIVSISQPAYLPWAGYFDRILKSDLHITLDHVNFERRGFTKRNKIRTHQGSMYLTVPVKTKGKFKDCPINELEILNEENWTHKHLQGIKSNYSKSPFYQEHIAFFEKIYDREWLLLNDIIQETNKYFLDILNIKTEIKESSFLKPQKVKSDLILELCQMVSATTYISGPLGRDYLDVKAFEEAEIKILYHDYECIPYPQLHGGFEPYMSIIDMLFNCGPESHNILQNSADCLKTE